MGVMINGALLFNGEWLLNDVLYGGSFSIGYPVMWSFSSPVVMWAFLITCFYQVCF
jgi:hypothetical protein